MNNTIELIVAMDNNRVIGYDNKLIWYIPLDLKNFKFLTSGHTIIMGRKTWESLPKRPLPDRNNVVITRNPEYVADGAVVVHSLEEALQQSPGKVFVIGGAEIYKQALPYADFIHITYVYNNYIGDAFFPEYNAELVAKGDMMEHNGTKYQFCKYKVIK